MLGKLGKAGHKATLEEARRRFKEHVEGKQILSADLRSPVSSLAPRSYRCSLVHLVLLGFHIADAHH